MSMSRRSTEFALIATGIGLWWLGSKTFSDYHENLSVGLHDSFQHKHATAIGSMLTLAGLGLAVYGTYGVNRTWGKVAGLGLASLVGWNLYKHQKGEPMISLAPFPLPRRFAHA